MGELDVVIVNYNTRDELQACLASIAEKDRPRVIVVDNGSTDGSAEMARQHFPQVSLLESPTNGGYGAGANLGIYRSRADYVLLLNSDTRLQPHTLDALAAYLDRHPEVAIAGPRLVNGDGTLQASCYPAPSPLHVLLQESGLTGIVGRLPIVRSRYLRTWPHDRARGVPWVLGAAIAIRRKAFESVSGFDERFSMYFEEVDLCERLHAAGWQVHFAPVTTITHLGGAATSKRRTEMSAQVWKSLRQFHCYHSSRFARFRLDVVTAIVLSARLIRESVGFRRSDDANEKKRLSDNITAWRIVLKSLRASESAPHPSTESPGAGCVVSTPPLRRADWRFLLPGPQAGAFEHLVLLGASESFAARLCKAGIARRISREIPATRCADAVALMGGNTHGCSWEAIAGCLIPGGLLYCEVDRRRLSAVRLSPAVLERRLRKVGLSTAGTYWLAPNLRLPNKYVPLDMPNATRWYLETLFMDASATQALIVRLLRGLVSLHRRLPGAVVPWYAVTAVAGRPGGAHISLLDAVAPDQLNARLILLTSGHDDGSRVVALPFADGCERPERVIKLARLPEFSTNIENEQRVLTDLHSRLDPCLSASLPQAFGLTHYGTLVMGMESCASGRSIFVSTGSRKSSNREKINDLRLAARWLTEFNRQTRLDDAASAEFDFVSRAERLFDLYAESFNATPNEQRLFAGVISRARELAGSTIPLVWRHNDFGPWNLYRANGSLQVIDWELGWGPGFEHTGPALCDLLYLVTHWSFVAHNVHTETKWAHAVRQLYVDRNWGDELIVGAYSVIDQYLSELGIDRCFVPLVLIYMWAERAEKRLDRRRLLGLPVPDSRSDDRFVMYINQLADHSNEFFALADDHIWTFAKRNQPRDTESLRDDLDDLSIHQSHHTPVG